VQISLKGRYGGKWVGIMAKKKKKKRRRKRKKRL
jgi:hypothetical protein